MICKLCDRYPGKHLEKNYSRQDQNTNRNLLGNHEDQQGLNERSMEMRAEAEVTEDRKYRAL